MKKFTIYLFLVAVLLLAACTVTVRNDITNEPINDSGKEMHTIEITSSGFSPSSLTIKQGDTVAFVNKDSAPHWTASAFHPTHSAYPESGGCIGSTFDACKGLSQGESWSFTFNEVGEWKYHDHLSSGDTGTIIVE